MPPQLVFAITAFKLVSNAGWLSLEPKLLQNAPAASAQNAATIATVGCYGRALSPGRFAEKLATSVLGSVHQKIAACFHHTENPGQAVQDLAIFGVQITSLWREIMLPKTSKGLIY